MVGAPGAPQPHDFVEYEILHQAVSYEKLLPSLQQINADPSSGRSSTSASERS